MKIAIVIITYNLPTDIFILQMQAIKKFCKDEDYVIEIFDNSTKPDLAEPIEYHAEQLGVNYRKTYSHSENGSDSHCWAANFAYQKIKEEYQAFFFVDHDVIPVCDFSVEKILSGGHVMAGLGQGAKKTYFWAGMVMWVADRVESELIDFGVDHNLNLDTGGKLYKVVDKYGKENCIFFNEAYHQNPNYNGLQYNHYAMLNNGTFCHIVNSSNWAGADRHEERINSMINVVKEKTGL